MTDLTPNDLSHMSDEDFNALCPQGHHAPGAEPLSPAAQAILDAYKLQALEIPSRLALAAVLRAVAELESIKPEALAPCDERYGPTDNQVTLSEQDYNYQLALTVKMTQAGIYRALRAIADELEDQ